MAERAVYFNYNGKEGGHDSIGVTEPANTWYLAEGYTGGDFDTWVLVQNPGSEDARVTLSFQLPPGKSAPDKEIVLPAGTRQSIHLDELEGLSDTDVSTKVTSDKPVVAERAVYFNYNGKEGGHDSIGVTEPANTWYLAEGYTGGDFDTWVLVQNPGSEDARVTLSFQLPPGKSAPDKEIVLPAGTRQSIHLDELEGLSDTDVSTKVTSDKPVVAERAVYFNYNGKEGGHDSIGVTEPANTWYLAEGYTGGDFDTWVLVQNPGSEDARVTLSFQLPPGKSAPDKEIVLPAGTRQSIHRTSWKAFPTPTSPPRSPRTSRWWRSARCTSTTTARKEGTTPSASRNDSGWPAPGGNADSARGLPTHARRNGLRFQPGGI
ncbi:MAG: hypothetical protein HPY75_13655 [Actinobacteria bacterium]|nr:hypothetical protein [Actinomycetota bacterium]